MLLTQREKIILEEIVKQFILTNSPVSSSWISKHSRSSMSPATVRNIMAALEQKGFIQQPHTSAGRIPNTQAYRTYVDQMMRRSRLSVDEKDQIKDSVQEAATEFDEVMREVTKMIAHLSRQLGIILSPSLDDGIFQRMEIIRLTSDTVLVVMTIQSGFVKTVTLEMDSGTPTEKMQTVTQVLNERLNGMKISEIRRHFADVVRDIRNEDSGLVKLFIRRADRLFQYNENLEMYMMGTHHMVEQLDFTDIQSISSVVQLLEEREIVIRLLDSEDEHNPIVIKIGEEIEEQRMQGCSIITARYRVGNINGRLGIIGPTRMNYSKLVSLVDYAARTISDVHGTN